MVAAFSMAVSLGYSQVFVILIQLTLKYKFSLTVHFEINFLSLLLIQISFKPQPDSNLTIPAL